LDGPKPDLAASGIEGITHISTLSFVRAARRAGIPYHLDDYRYGTHIWPYWARDLRDLVPRLMQVFGDPVAPAKIAYESVDPQWTQWGWTVANAHPQRRGFSSLSAADAAGFTLRALGTATVTTPASYLPGSVHTVVIRDSSGTRTTGLLADAAGRLTIGVNLHTVLNLGPGTARVRIG
jgi:hypothetical protein